MMDTHVPVIVVSLAALVAISIVSFALLTAWRDWIALKKLAFSIGQDVTCDTSPSARIELAALKERVRKLEAIASGVDLLP